MFMQTKAGQQMFLESHNNLENPSEESWPGQMN